MITILDRPYDGLQIKVNPVYNGLAFVVDSDKKLVPNFRYVAEIYASSNKIGELRHNPDITSSNYGIFDVGRVVENSISYDLQPTTLLSANFGNMTNTIQPYFVRFGEEYSRLLGVSLLNNATGAYAGKVRITSAYPHNLSTGDRVLLQGTSISTYNTWSNVYKLSSTQFVLTDITYTTSTDITDAYFIQGEAITGWSQYTGADGSFYLQLKTKVNSTFNVGDQIEIRQDRKNQSGTTVAVVNTNYENVEWTITQKINQSTLTYLRTNIPYGTAIAANIWGSIISRNNFVLFNQISTQNDSSYAFAGCAQYDTFLTYSVNDYVFDGTQSGNNFLTLNPTNEIDVCPGDYWTLPYFGTNIIKQTQPTNIGNRRMRVETYSTSSFTASVSSIASDSSILSTRLQLTFTGQNYASQLTNGSELNLYYQSGTVSCNVLRTYTSSGNTITILDIPYVLYTQPIWLEVVNQVRRYDVFMATNMGQIGCGPANLNLAAVEINNGTCYKYKVYSILYGSTIYTSTTWSEVYTFNIKCNCKDKTQIMFQNENGVFDYFFFDGRIDKKRNIEKQDWRRHLKKYRSGSGYSYQMGDRGLSTYNTKSYDEWIIRSRYLTQAEIDWLGYIYESPEVYIVNGGKLLPITVIDTEFIPFDKKNVGEMGRLYYYTITFRMSNDRVIQRG